MLGNVAYVGLDAAQLLDVVISGNRGAAHGAIAVDVHFDLADAALRYEAGPDKGGKVWGIFRHAVTLWRKGKSDGYRGKEKMSQGPGVLTL